MALAILQSASGGRTRLEPDHRSTNCDISAFLIFYPRNCRRGQALQLISSDRKVGTACSAHWAISLDDFETRMVTAERSERPLTVFTPTLLYPTYGICTQLQESSDSCSLWPKLIKSVPAKDEQRRTKTNGWGMPPREAFEWCGRHPGNGTDVPASHAGNSFRPQTPRLSNLTLML